jgi:integrase
MIPLSEPSLDILKNVKRQGKEPLLFPAANGSGKSASGISRVKWRLDEALETDDWVIHDLRRTVATGLQRLGIRFEVTEAILNHISGAKGGVAGIYQRHSWAEEKRDALQLWGQDLMRIVI